MRVRRVRRTKKRTKRAFERGSHRRRGELDEEEVGDEKDAAERGLGRELEEGERENGEAREWRGERRGEVRDEEGSISWGVLLGVRRSRGREARGEETGRATISFLVFRFTLLASRSRRSS